MDDKNIHFVQCVFVRIFVKCMHVCAAQKPYLIFTKLYIEPDFPSLVDEKAEPHPDMNIKVAAFTVSEKSSNIYVIFSIDFAEERYDCYPDAIVGYSC